MVEVIGQTPTGRLLGGRLVNQELVAPAILDAEVASALRRVLLRGGSPRSDIESALGVLRSWPIERVGYAHLIRISMQWWENVSAYDALYLAVARSRGATILTVDGALARAPITDVVVENVRVGR